MKSTIEELGPTRVRMAIEVPWGDLDHAFGEVYKELGKQVRVPGFRPGKVPNRVLDQRIGRPVVLEQVVQHADPGGLLRGRPREPGARARPARDRGDPPRRQRHPGLHRRGRRRPAARAARRWRTSPSPSTTSRSPTRRSTSRSRSCASASACSPASSAPAAGRRLRLHRPRGQAQRRGARGRLDHRHVLRGRLRQPHGGPRRRRPRAVRRRVEDLPDGAAVRPERRRDRPTSPSPSARSRPRSCPELDDEFASDRQRVRHPRRAARRRPHPAGPHQGAAARARRPATSWSST